MTKEKSSSSGLLATRLFLGIVSIGAGAYHGYCNAHGIPFEKENLEWTLTYGPAIIQGSLGAIGGGVVNLSSSGAIGATSGWNDSALEKIAKGTGLGGAVGGITAGAQTLIGYGVGYLAGYMTK